MSHRQLKMRSLQVVAVATAYAIWLISQNLIEQSRNPLLGFRDHSHEWLAGANAWLHAHPAIADVILAVSSFEVDLAAGSLVFFFFVRRESRPSWRSG